MLTIQPVEFDWRPAVADVTCVPSTTVGPSTYLSPEASQETVWSLGSSHWDFWSVYPTVAFQLSSTVLAFGPGLQTSLSNSFMVAALTWLGSPNGPVSLEAAGDAVEVGDVVRR